MTKETLPTGPEKQERSGLKSKVKEIFGTLGKSKEQTKMEMNIKNDRLLKSFDDKIGNHYKKRLKEIKNPYHMRDLKYIQPGDTIIFDSLETLNNREIDKSKLIDNYGKFIGKNYTTIKIKDEGNLADLEYLFEHLDLKWYPTKIVFPEFTFGNYGGSYTKKAIKILKKFLLKTDRYGCYFDIGENIHTGGYSDKNNYLKDLITRFTKQGKSGKLRDCVIKANGKEYHCSGDYRYDFE